VGALAHYLESEGIPTTQISLIREHTEIIRPPRALWVPFDLGRPLGAPENQELQRLVLLEVLGLLEAAEGPLLVDFAANLSQEPEETGKGLEGCSCPVGFAPDVKQQTEPERLRSAFLREVSELRPWYDLSLEKRGRTAMVKFSPDTASKLLGSYASGETAEIQKGDVSPAMSLRLAVQDLKAFYFEAAAARPGSASPSSHAFNLWFWQETAAGRVVKAVKERCLKEADPSLRMTGAKFLIPVDRA
jgi:hypothetical protein